MPRTPDEFPGTRLEEEVLFEPSTVQPTSEGAIRYVDGSFIAVDSSGSLNLRTGGGGITEAQHKALRQLTHFIEEGPGEGFTSGAHKETSPVGPFPTLETWWESVAKLKKIVELETEWAGAFPSTETWRVYGPDGVTILVTLVDEITYQGAFEASRTRTWS